MAKISDIFHKLPKDTLPQDPVPEDVQWDVPGIYFEDIQEATAIFHACHPDRQLSVHDTRGRLIPMVRSGHPAEIYLTEEYIPFAVLKLATEDATQDAFSGDDKVRCGSAECTEDHGYVCLTQVCCAGVQGRRLTAAYLIGLPQPGNTIIVCGNRGCDLPITKQFELAHRPEGVKPNERLAARMLAGFGDPAQHTNSAKK